jgi:protein SDA1
MSQDLVGYRKFKNKEVSAAARSLVGLFRELAPGMLAKKDRGRDADLAAAPAEYGAAAVSDRIEVRPAAKRTR